jgi:hypothetical protein
VSAATRFALLAATVVAAGATFAMCDRVSDRGRFALSYSTYGAGPEGARAAFELTRLSGWDARRWNEDVASLPSPATLVAIGGCDHLQSRAVTRPEREALLRWVEAGGTWIVAGATDMLDHASYGVRLTSPGLDRCLEDDGLLGMMIRAERQARETRRAREAGPEPEPEPEPVPEPEPDTAADPFDKPPPLEDPVAALAETLGGADPSEREWAGAWEGPLAGMPMAGLRRSGFIEIEDDVPHEVLARIEGKAAIVVVPRGRGRIVVLSSGSAFQNRDLVEAEGAPLLVRLLRLYANDGPVLFDEYHLGAGEARSTMRYLFQLGAGPLAAHLLLVVALLVLRAGARFGAPRREREAEPVTTASFVSAVGALFAKVRDPRGSLEILARRAYARIAAHHHVDELDPVRLERALRERRRTAAADAVQQISALAGTPRHEGLTRAARELDALAARALADGA